MSLHLKTARRTTGRLCRSKWTSLSLHGQGSLFIEGELVDGTRFPCKALKDGQKRTQKAKLQKFMNANPSVVFFRELAPGLPGPIGASGCANNRRKIGGGGSKVLYRLGAPSSCYRPRRPNSDKASRIS